MSFVKDIKYGLNVSNRYNIGNYFLAFEDIIKSDPGGIISKNMPELLNRAMNTLAIRDYNDDKFTEMHSDE